MDTKALVMEREIKIKYWWKCYQFPKGIPKEFEKELEENALDRIEYLMKDGIVEGELCAYVLADVKGRKTPEDGWECSGGFTITTNGE